MASTAVAAIDVREALRAVGVRTREDDAYDGCAVRVRGRLEGDVDRRATVLHTLIGREGEAARLDLQVVIGRRDVHTARRQHVLVIDLAHGQCGRALQQAHQPVTRPIRRPMEHDDDACFEVGTERLEHAADGTQPTPGGADHDDPA